MPRGAKIDRQATQLARERKQLRDPRSFIDPNGRVFLEGRDVRRARARVFGRDEGCCVDCGKEVAFDEGAWGRAMEWSHEVPRSLGGSDDDANTRTRCSQCHRKHDGHGQPMHF